MMTPRPSAVLIVLASVAVSVVLTLTLLGSTQQVDETVAPSGSVDVARLKAIEDRLAALERRPAVLSGRPAELRAPAVTVPDEATREFLVGLEKRLAKLESSRRTDPRDDLADLLLRVDRNGRNQEARDAERSRTIELAQGVIADPTAAAEQKVQAHRSLRHVSDAYTPAMLREMIAIGMSDPNPEFRAHTWCFFDGATTDVSLVNPLLSALAHDKSGHVRSEAAETLGNYGTDPAVLQALEYAAKNDSDISVRRKAIRTLREVKGGWW